MISANGLRLNGILRTGLLAMIVVLTGSMVSAQTPDLSGLTLSTSLGNNSVNEGLVCDYTLTGSATTAATAWYCNGEPVMSFYLPLEGGATAAIGDYSGNNVPVSYIGTPGWSATIGHEGSGGITFDGTRYLNASRGFPTNSSYTVTAWIYRTIDKRFTFIVGSNLSGGVGHSLRVESDDLLSAGQNGNRRIAKSMANKNKITTNTWVFVAVTYDRATGQMILYKNAIPIDTGYAVGSEMAVTDSSMRVGANAGDVNAGFIGTIDDVRTYKHALTPDQITGLFTSGQNRISPSENHVGDVWRTGVTPFSSVAAGPTYLSNAVTIIPTAPAFATGANVLGIADQPYVYDADADGGPHPTFTLNSGPLGMTINEATGVLTWSPSVAGPYGVSITAVNSQGSATQDFTINVAAPSVGIDNLQLQVLENGDLVSSNDPALGATSSETVWYRNGQPLMTLYMPFEGGIDAAGNDNRIRDLSGNNHPVKLVGNLAWASNSGHDGSGVFTFNGDGYLECGNKFPTHSSYTKTIWFYHTVSGKFQHLLSGWDHSETSGHGIRVAFDDRFSAGHNGNWRIVESQVRAVQVNRWYFGAVTFDHATGQMILYLNGIPVDTAIVTAQQLEVVDPGLQVGSTRGEYAWEGYLDDARVYNYVLSPEQIAAMATTGGKNRIVAGETADGDVWQSKVTAFSANEASAEFSSNEVTIGALNQPPTLATIGTQAVNEMQTLTFTVTASDPDLTIPSFSTSTLPANAAFVDNGNGEGMFTFTPSFNQAGTIHVTFYATDGSATDSEIVAIVVTNVNRPPVLAGIGSQTVAEGSVLDVNLTASDPDGGALVLSAVDIPENAVFVDNGDDSGDFSFMPGFLQAGEYDVWFRVFDESLAGDSELVHLTVTDTPQNALWTATIHAQGETVGTAIAVSSVIVGTSTQKQTTPITPAPPEYTTRLQIIGQDGFGPYYRDVRLLGEDCNYWTIDIDPHGNAGAPTPARCATLTWDPLEFSPDNNYILREGIDPNGPIVVADMRSTTSFEVCDVQTSRYYTIHWISSACSAAIWATLNLEAGWNLVSLPVLPSSTELTDIFPTAEAAFEFDGNYSEVTSLETCVGYWVKVPEAVSVVLSGVPVTDCSTIMTAGWHLVGAPACTATPLTTPGGALQAMYEFDGSYQPATGTSANSGYWVNLSTSCTLELGCGSPAARVLKTSSDRLILTVERETPGIVSFASVELGVDAESSTLLSPPEAPEYTVGMRLYREGWDGPYYRDIRSAGGDSESWTLAVNPTGNETVQGIRTALLSWDPTSIDDAQFRLVEGTNPDGRVLVEDMRAVSGIEVIGGDRDQYFTIVRTVSKNVSGLPGDFALDQNYPNPFNPSTTISFSLPEASDVVLEVFNIIGQKIITLTNSFHEAGTFQIEWTGVNSSGAQVASGIYFYRIQAGSNSETRKMVLLK